MNDWTGRALDELLRLRDRSGAWGYRNDRGPSAEPTALACLGLWSCRSHSPPEARREAIQRGADWLQTLQKADGSLGIAPSLPSPCWATPHAILLWNALEVHAPARRRAAAWLLEQKGNPSQSTRPTSAAWSGTTRRWWAGPGSRAPTPGSSRRPWRSWRWTGKAWGTIPASPREFVWSSNRALAQGGWNYGNTSVFGRQLRPQPGPTGLALLALAAHASEHRPRSVDPAIAYLLRTLPDVRAPISLAWGVLGLRAWNASPAAAADWLAESYSLHAGRRDVTTGLSLLLLAHGG